MAAWRSLVIGAVALAAASTARAQTYTLAEEVKAGDCFHVHIDMKLNGTMRFFQEQEIKLQQEAAATHDFVERVLLIGDNHLPQKVARHYSQAEMTRTVEGDRFKEQLRPDRKLFVAQRPKDHTLVYSPDGTLTRTELDLAGGHFDTLHLTALLPQREVSVGDTWKVTNPVMQALCNFEGLTTQDLTCKLEEVKDNVAIVTFEGTANGIDLGAMARLTISGKLHFDLTNKRLTFLKWKQRDERDQGPVSPAFDFEITTSLDRKPIPEPETLSTLALVAVPEGLEEPLHLMPLYHRDPQDRFELAYEREWHITADTAHHFIMRLMDRGDWLAQVTITPWTRARAGEHMTGERFHEEMATNTPGWVEEQILQAGEFPLDGGRWCYRISALGQLDEVKTLQNFYLIASPAGEQVVITFTMRQAQAEKFGTRDLSLVGSFDFPSNHKK